MKRSAFKTILIAPIALALGVIPSTALLAQNTGGTPGIIPFPQGGFNPAQFRRNIRLSPSLNASATASTNPISVGPGQGPTGTPFQVRTNGNLGGVPIFVTFVAEPYRAAPVAFSSRLSGGGNSFSTPVPAQLCYYGTRVWEVHVKLSNGREFNRIGTFTPTNCQR